MGSFLCTNEKTNLKPRKWLQRKKIIKIIIRSKMVLFHIQYYN
jgi:hypothetical protein